MATDISRYIKREVERELWARAAGRCQFDGCNRLLYKSPVTQEQVNISEKAHIYSFSEDGPRGWGPFISNKDKLNDVDNLMLMCHDCHKTIDQDKEGIKYSADLLQSWKREHEQRVLIASGIASDKKSHVVFYGSNIGDQKSPIQRVETMEAMFPDRYPADEQPIKLSMECSHDDSSDAFWQTESAHLTRIFTKYIEPKIEENNPAHFSIFALAPMPLLIQLGSLFTDKITVDVYQPIREPKTWKWQPMPDDFDFHVLTPVTTEGIPVLVISLSGRIMQDRITSVIEEPVAIWEITVDEKFLHNDFIKSSAQLSLWRTALRKLMEKIKQEHGQQTPLHVFPAMPISCAIEMGRIRMPKSEMLWVIYDQNHKHNKFVKALTIGE